MRAPGDYQSTQKIGGSVLIDAPDGLGQFHAVFTPPEPCTVTGPGGLVGEVIRVLIDINTEGHHSQLAARSAFHNDEVTTLAEAEILGGEFRLVAREPLTGQPSISAAHSRRANARTD